MRSRWAVCGAVAIAMGIPAEGPLHANGNAITRAAGAPLPSLTWTYPIFGSDIGGAGLLARDLQGDGSVEIVVTSSSGGGSRRNDIWRIMRRGSGLAYDDVWVSRWYEHGIARIAVADADRDGISEIYVGLPDGTVEIHDGVAPGSPAVVAIGHSLRAMEIADVDGDGSLDLLASNREVLSCRALAPPYARTWLLPTSGGTDIAVGQVDGDPAPEVVVTKDSGTGPGLVIDGATRAVEWRYANGFGVRVRCGDVDADGRDEIVAAAAWHKVTAFDAEIHRRKWEIPIELDIGALRLENTDGDAVPEIIVGEGQWGSILCFDAATRAQRWAIGNPGHGVADVAVADVDADGALELLWSARGLPEALYIANIAERHIDWQSTSVDGPLSAVGSGDVDGDGAVETVLISYSSADGVGPGIIHVFDGVTHELEWTGAAPPGTWDGGHVRSVIVANVDADPRDEIVYTYSDVDGKVVVLDGAARTVKRASATFHGNLFSALAAADVDGDGAVEIVAGQGRGAYGDAPGVFLLVFDGATMAEEWRSADLGIAGGSVSDIAVGCVDGDGRTEIVAVTSGGKAYVYDAVTHHLDWLAGIDAQSVEIADVDDDGAPEILLGRNGVVEAYGGVTHALESRHAVGAGPVVGLRAVDGPGRGPWLLASDGATVARFAWDAPAATWESPVLGTDAGRHNHLVVADADGNGRRELLIGSHYALFEFALDGVPDGIPRVGSVVRRDANPATSSSVAFTVTFTEPVTGVDTAPPFADFGIATAGVTGASITAVAGEGDTYTVTVSTGAGDGTIRLDVVDDDGVVAADGTPLGGAGAGNGDYAAGEVYDIWYNPRVASVVRADPDPTSSSAVHFTVTFSKPVTGVDTAPPFGDFAVRGTGAPTGTIAEVSGSGATYLVTVSVNAHGGNGTIRLDVRDDDSVLDELGNRLGGAGAGNGAFTAGERYSVLTVPLPLAPRGRIADARPVYRWTAVPGATRYRYRALKGSKVLFTRIVEPGSCDEYAVCSDAPPQALGVGAHAWRVQAGIDDAWRSYSRSTSFTVSPKAGLWDGYAMEFHVTPGLGSVDDFAVYIYVAECGSYKITHTPRLRIADGRFGFDGPFYATGVFSGVENAAGRLGLRSLSIPGCGYVSGGPYAWSAVWKDGPAGIALAAEAEPAFITSLDEATPGDAAARGRFEVRVVPESAAGRP